MSHHQTAQPPPSSGAAYNNDSSSSSSSGTRTGRQLEEDTSHDLHFVCGCSNFEPVHNGTLRELAKQLLMEKDNSYFAGSVPVSELVPQLMKRAHEKARQDLGSDAARFRIWYTGENGPQPKDDSWKALTYFEITNNDGLLKKRLSSPIRGAFGEVLLQRLEQSKKMPSASAAADGQVAPPQNATSATAPAQQQQMLKGLRERFETLYNERATKMALGRLEDCIAGQDTEEWACGFYQYFFNTEHAHQIDEDRRAILKPLYQVLNEFDEWNQRQPQQMSLDDVAPRLFKIEYLTRILAVALPMDRAQALYHLPCGSNASLTGVPWWSELHLAADTWYAQQCRDEQAEWAAYLKELAKNNNGDTPEPPMNKRLFRVLYCPTLGLQRKDKFARWSRPAKVPDESERPLDTGAPLDFALVNNVPTEVSTAARKRRHAAGDSQSNSLIDEDDSKLKPTAEKRARPPHDGSLSLLGSKSSLLTMSGLSQIDQEQAKEMLEQAENGAI